VRELLYNDPKEDQRMSKRPRRNHAPAFKAKVALEAIKGEQTLVELSQRYQVHPNQITEWKKQLLESAPDIFSRSKKAETGPDIKDLHAKIGQLAMENDFLSNALGRIDGPSAKK
jgi:transposase